MPRVPDIPMPQVGLRPLASNDRDPIPEAAFGGEIAGAGQRLGRTLGGISDNFARPEAAAHVPSGTAEMEDDVRLRTLGAPDDPEAPGSSRGASTRVVITWLMARRQTATPKALGPQWAAWIRHASRGRVPA